MNDQYTLKNAYEIVIHSKDDDITIPITSCELEIVLENIQHFSSIMGRKRKDMEIITRMDCSIHFTPDGPFNIETRKDMVSKNPLEQRSIDELMNAILAKQAENAELLSS